MSQNKETFDYGNFFGSIQVKNLTEIVNEKSYLEEQLEVYADMAAPKEAAEMAAE